MKQLPHAPNLEIAGPAVYIVGMADPASIFDPEDEDAEERALLEAEADIAAGRTVPWEDVKRWLESWGTPTELPPPECK